MALPTQKDIARELGVSITTVSLALRNHPRIPEFTRLRVLETAERLGYRVNPLVAALMTQIRGGRPAGRGTVIGLITPKGGRTFLENNPRPYIRSMLDSIRRRAEDLGYQLDWFESDRDDGRADAAARVAAYRGVRGLLIPPVEQEGTVVAADWSPFSVVAIGQSHVAPGLHHIGHNLTEGMKLLTTACFSRGYRRVGLRLQPRYDQRTGKMVTGGFFAGLEEAGVQRVSSRWLHKSENNRSALWIDWVRRERLDALITQVPEDLSRARAEGLRIPEDMGLAFLSVPEPGGELTGIHQDPEALGHAAVDLLTSFIHRNETGPPPFAKTVLTSPVWCEGSTLPSRV